MLKQFSFILIYLLLLLPGAQNNGLAAATPTLATDSSVRFIANEGQWPSSARFQATTRDGVLWLTDEGLWLTRTTPKQGQINIHLGFAGMNAAARWEPFDRQETVVSYFHGSDPEQWQGGVPVWGGVLVHDLVPGADLRLTGQNGQLVTEWVVTGEVGEITLQVEGADEVQQRGRELHFLTPAGSLTWPLPTSPTPLKLNITNATNELNIPLSTQHSALSTQYSSSGSPLIFGTFIGGEDVLPDVPHAIALDPQGNIYTTGYTESPVFPTEPGVTPQHGIDVIITKLLPDGSDLAYAIHINPSAFNQPDWGYDILVNNAGEAYVVGETNSFDFPITPGALDNTFDDGEAFFLKVAADGASLLYSTFLGGADLDGIRGLAQDSAGNFYVTGQTWSLDFPTTVGAYDGIHNGARDAFVTKLNPTGTAILYSTFLGGDTQEQGQVIGVTADGQATITGWTNSANYPTTSGAWDETFNGEFDVFVTRLNSSGTNLSYSTFIGGDNEDRPNDLVLHNDGRVTLTGSTFCPCTIPFPTTVGVYDPTHNDNYDAFVAQLNNAGNSLVFSTFLGGTNEDRGLGLALTNDGRILVTGRTESPAPGFPITGDAAATTVLYSTFLGGINEDEGSSVLVGPGGTLILSGSTRSADFPVTPGAYNTTLNGDYDIFIVKLQVWDSPLFNLFLPLLQRP
jgi:hypothetical protein